MAPKIGMHGTATSMKTVKSIAAGKVDSGKKK
jgi:hypothetical protein